MQSFVQITLFLIPNHGNDKWQKRLGGWGLEMQVVKLKFTGF